MATENNSAIPSLNSPEQELTALNFEQENILKWLKKVRFKKKLFGGVSEIDVWKKIDELNKMYNAALNAERVRYDALLSQRESAQIQIQEINR